MSGRAFGDTNALLYAHDVSTGDRHKRARSLVETLWHERTGATPHASPPGARWNRTFAVHSPCEHPAHWR
jgi:hypothetical protein